MKYLEKLNKEQKQAVTSESKEIMLIAGAGTGKTNTIIKKVEYLVKEKKIPQEKILTVTFTNKAVNEIKERLNKYLGKNTEVVVNTFHELARNIVYKNENYKLLGYEKLTIATDEQREDKLENILEATEDFYYLNTNIKDVSVKKVLKDFSLMKNDLYIEVKSKEFEKNYKELFGLYNASLFFSELIDLDDLIINAVELLKEHNNLLEAYRNQFEYIFIDEYQDINKIQYKLISLLKNKNNILIVGDEDQSIYSFRGSNSKYFKEFKEKYQNAEIIKLEKNYRSTKEILNLADNFIKQNKLRIDKTLYTEKTGNKPKIYTNSNIHKQIKYTLDKIKTSEKYNDNAILIRSKNIEILTTLKTNLFEYNIPFKIIGEYTLHKRKIIKDLIYLLRFIGNKKNNFALKRIIKNFKLGLGKKFLEKLEHIRRKESILHHYNIIKNHKKYDSLKKYEKKINTFLETFNSHNINKSFDELIEEVIDVHFENTTNKDYSYLQEFLKEAKEYYKRNGYKTIDEYIDYIEHFQELETKDKLQILTMHASKGLEFKNVYILNLAENYPYLYKNNYAELEKNDLKNNNIIEEERRLLYVAMTRAEENLYILGSENNRYILELKEILNTIT